MGLTLDEPKANDKIVEAEGVSLIVDSEVANLIQSFGKLMIDYKDRPWSKGFQLTFPGTGFC